MGLPWVRLDTQFASNPKILELAARRKWRAAFVYVASLAYCGQHGTDGYIPETALPFIHSTRSDASTLVNVGLWHTASGGWEINGWLEFQLSNDETRERRVRQEIASKKANCVRWHGKECGCWRHA